MKIGEYKARVLTGTQNRVIAAAGVIALLLVAGSTYTHMQFRHVRALVVGNTIDLASRAEGRIAGLPLEENERFQRGAVLVRLANDGLRSAMESTAKEAIEIRQSLALEHSGQGLERRRYDLQEAEAGAQASLAAARIRIESIDRLIDGLAARRDQAAARLARAEELAAAGAMTVAELESRRREALAAARDYEDAQSRRGVQASEAEKQSRILALERQRLANLDGERTSMINDLEMELADTERELGRLRDLWNELTIVAEHDGVVTAVHRRPGEYVPAGERIMTVMNGDDIWVEAYMPAEEKRGVRAGDPVEIRGSATSVAAQRGHIDRILPVLRPYPDAAAGIGIGGGERFAVLIIRFDDAAAARAQLSPAQRVSARVIRHWGWWGGKDAVARDRAGQARRRYAQ